MDMLRPLFWDWAVFEPIPILPGINTPRFPWAPKPTPEQKIAERAFILKLAALQTSRRKNSPKRVHDFGSFRIVENPQLPRGAYFA